MDCLIHTADIPLNAVLDTVLDGIITIDSRGNILSFSKAATTIFGYTLDEVAGKNVKMLMPEPYHSRA
jgi:PAS domain S-box-containing protein